MTTQWHKPHRPSFHFLSFLKILPSCLKRLAQATFFSLDDPPSLSLCGEPTRFLPISIHLSRIETPLKNTISARLPFFLLFRFVLVFSEKKEEMLSAVDKLNPIKICWGAGGLARDTAGTSSLPSGHAASQSARQVSE